jgi:hypothetical protein
LTLSTHLGFAELRTWTSQDEKTVEAELVSSDGKKLELRLPNGRSIDMPLVNLSKADQDFVATLKIDKDFLAGLRDPDKSVVLPDNLRDEAEACFAKGYTYFVWLSEAGPFRRDKSGLLVIPFNYVSKHKPEQYDTAITVITQKVGKDRFESLTQRITPPKYFYSSAGKGAAMIIDIEKTLSGKGSAKVKLFGTGKRKKIQISNEFSAEIEF